MFAKIFISLSVVCAVIGTLNAQTVWEDQQDDCPKICPDMYDPVCASDGATYQEFANPCEFKANNCNLQLATAKPFVPTDSDWCHTEKLDNWDSLLVKLGQIDFSKPECSKVCNKIYKPVCISNGKYRIVVSNECLVDNINCALDTQDTFKVLRNGTC